MSPRDQADIIHGIHYLLILVHGRLMYLEFPYNSLSSTFRGANEASWRLSTRGLCDIFVSDLALGSQEAKKQGGDGALFGFPWQYWRLSPSFVPCVWDAAILRRRWAHDQSLPSESHTCPARQPALAGVSKNRKAVLQMHSLAELRSKTELTLTSLFYALVG